MEWGEGCFSFKLCALKDLSSGRMWGSSIPGGNVLRSKGPPPPATQESIHLACWRKSKESRADGGVWTKPRAGDEFRDREKSTLQGFINYCEDLGSCWMRMGVAGELWWWHALVYAFQGSLGCWRWRDCRRAKVEVGRPIKRLLLEKILTLQFISTDTLLASFCFPPAGVGVGEMMVNKAQ